MLQPHCVLLAHSGDKLHHQQKRAIHVIWKYYFFFLWNIKTERQTPCLLTVKYKKVNITPSIVWWIGLKQKKEQIKSDWVKVYNCKAKKVCANTLMAFRLLIETSFHNTVKNKQFNSTFQCQMCKHTLNLQRPPMSSPLSKHVGSSPSSKQDLMLVRPDIPAPITATVFTMLNNCEEWEWLIYNLLTGLGTKVNKNICFINRCDFFSWLDGVHQK